MVARWLRHRRRAIQTLSSLLQWLVVSSRPLRLGAATTMQPVGGSLAKVRLLALLDQMFCLAAFRPKIMLDLVRSLLCGYRLTPIYRGRTMRATAYSFLFVALLLSGCTNTPFHRNSGTYARTTSDELYVTPASEFVRAGAENYETEPLHSVPSEPSKNIADAQSVNYYPTDEPRQRSSLIPTRWDANVMKLIPTRWDAGVVFADLRQHSLPEPPTPHAR